MARGLFAVFGLLTLGLAVCTLAIAGPAESGVRSFRALVPDFSKTSGAERPALSPDGRTLAFNVNGNHQTLWILHSKESLLRGNQSDLVPWKLEFESPGDFPAETDMGKEWSSDGKRLAFVLNGRLYIASQFDFEAKTADVRPLSGSVTLDGDSLPCAMRSPRWSPDGSKIAFLRGHPSGKGAIVCTVDVASEQEKRLCDGAADWGKPWSPMGDALVYSSVTPKGVMRISADDKDKRLVYKGDTVGCPGWLRGPSRITYGVRRSKKLYTEPRAVSFDCCWTEVMASDVNGQGSTLLCRSPLPDASYLTLMLTRMNRLLTQSLEQQFGSVLTQTQRSKLASGKLSCEDLSDIAAMCAAREIGPSFAVVMERALRKHGPDGDRAFSDAVMSLPADKREQFLQRALGSMASVFPIVVQASDLDFVLSPDGSRVAYLGCGLAEGDAEVTVAKTSGVGGNVVFRAASLDSVMWSAEGKYLVIEGRRAMSKTVEDDETNVTMSYPEVWLVEPM